MELNQINEFNQLVLEKLQPFFDKNNFKIVETWKGLINLKSSVVTMSLAYNNREYENYFFIRLNEYDYPIEINDEILKKVFHSSIKIKSLPTEHFLDNLASFGQEGEGLLKGDLKMFNELKEYLKIKTMEYNKKFTRK